MRGIDFGVCLDADEEGSGTIANREILGYGLQSDGRELSSAVFGDHGRGLVAALAAGSHTTIDSDVIVRARRFDDAETGFGRVEGEGVGVGARHVLDAAITLLLSDASTVVLRLQMRRVGGDKVEGGDSTGETGEILEAAFGIPPGSAARNLSRLDFPASALGGTGSGELKGNGVGALGTEFDVNVLASILSANGGDVLRVGRRNFECIFAFSTVGFLGVSGSSDGERVKV